MTATTGRNDTAAARVRRFERSAPWAWFSLLLLSATAAYVLMADSVPIVWRVLVIVAWICMAISTGMSLRAPRR